MECVRQIVDSELLDGLNLPVALRNRKVEVIVLPAEDALTDEPNPQKREVQFGFLKDKVPPLPDSFFDPLPEEELQAWGL